MGSAAAPQLAWLMQPLRPWLMDPATEEICINGPGAAFVRQGGAFARHELAMDQDDLEDLAILAGALRGQDVGSRNPLCSTELPGGERLQVVLPPATPGAAPSLTIRKPGGSIVALSDATRRYRLDRWNRWSERGATTRQDRAELLALYDAGDIEVFLEAAVRARLNILLCGATGSGKTTMSKTLMTAINQDDRIITIEDTLELHVPQPNHVRLLYSKGVLSGAEIGAESLLEASLRMRPDRVFLQELRDPAAAYVYINEVMTGHPGSLTTIHGRDAPQAFKRLFNLIKGSDKGAHYADQTLIDMLDGAIDLIVPFHNIGSVFEIGEVWFAAEAARRGENCSALLRMT
jgi:type IV secretion system protein VirB11